MEALDVGVDLRGFGEQGREIQGMPPQGQIQGTAAFRRKVVGGQFVFGSR